MPKVIDISKAIVYDADVIIHFIYGDKLLDLFKIYKNSNIILEPVYEELSKSPKTKTAIDNLKDLKVIEIFSFSGMMDIVKEYAYLRSKLMNKGKGESACLAFCKHNKDIIASSNLRDIKVYCKLHSIENLTTMDFVLEAYTSGLWELDECEKFIVALKKKNQKIPCNTFIEYLNKSKAS